MREVRPRYGMVDRLFHWLVFFPVAVQFAIGWSMPELHEGSEIGALVQLHFSVGTLTLAIVFLRSAWRWTFPVSPASGLPHWQEWLARQTHRTLYVLLVINPILGWIGASSNGQEVTFFGLFTLPSLAMGEALGHILGEAHGALVTIMLGLIGIHIVAALYHHFVLRDEVLQEMLPVKCKHGAARQKWRVERS